MNKIDSQARTIKELLGNKYTLDYYQREYVWQSENVCELLNDLKTKFQANYEKKHEPAEVDNYSHYFLGSIVICEKGTERFIIDGQQRLTTLTLLLIHLYHSLADEGRKNQVSQLILSTRYGEKSFNLDIDERQHIMAGLYSEAFFEISDQSESIRNIAARYKDIEKHLQLHDQALSYFVDWLLERVYLVEITAYDDLNAYTIFETMNDRGLSLTPAEMLRGYLLSNITDAEPRKSANSIWRKQCHSLQTPESEEVSDAIKAWLRSQYAETIRDFERIGSEFHRWVREQEQSLKLTSSDNFANFVEHNFEFYTTWYLRLRNAANSLPDALEHGLECVYYNAQNNFTLQYPILLSPLRIEDTEEEILHKIKIGATFLDILIHRRIWNFQDIAQRAMVDSMFRVMRDLRGLCSNELSDVLDNRLKVETPSFDNNRLFHLHGGNRRKICLILARMTDYIGVQSGQPSRYSEYVKKGSDRYDIEHIWASYPDHHHDDFSHEVEFEAYRNRIGGLLLLPKKINSNYVDLPYVEKLNYYGGQNLLAASLHEQTYQRTPGFLRFIDQSGLPFHPHPKFKRTDFDARQELYQLLAEQIWNPERLHENGS